MTGGSVCGVVVTGTFSVVIDVLNAVVGFCRTVVMPVVVCCDAVVPDAGGVCASVHATSIIHTVASKKKIFLISFTLKN